MDKEYAFRLTEPVLISSPSGKPEHYILPAGTILFHQKSYDEGHSTYIIELNYKGMPPVERVDSKVGSENPLWAYPVSETDLRRLTADYPLTRDELAALLKARKISRDELAQIVREWKD
ncbi:hypothetical protein [Azonexus sp.]|uniref:hypothetical protein n=1 Tax=Azonexus sp. TaxID=1872668 RepID=UPI0028341D70|nr:hypothetical protein [Azonexus sp.]MDR1994173.1 hypothetical protein [Azonexus sp.]